MTTNPEIILEPAPVAQKAGFYQIPARPRILIVDDEDAVRGIFASCLSDRYDCTESASVMDAFAQLAQEEFALVITDVLMPGLSGVELLRKIIDNHPQTAVIMVSGVNQPHRALDAVRLGAFDYLIKPCDLDVLELTVERALQHRELMLDARRYKGALEERVSELASQKAELQRLQAQIVHSEKMASLGQLAAGIAHELNNPAAFIYGNMDLLRQYLGELKELLDAYSYLELTPVDSEVIDAIKKKIDYENTVDDLSTISTDCHEGAKRINEIVQNLRVFTRLDEAEAQKTDVSEGIESTLRLLSRYFSTDKLTISRNYGELPLVDAFPGQLNQVWMNLLVNAAQSLGTEGGEISISTIAHAHAVEIVIADTGRGISPEHMRRIFDPFFTTKQVGEGMGLGLSICFSIVERHGGTIDVDSSVGSGTRFTVKLPVIRQSSEKNGVSPQNTDIH